MNQRTRDIPLELASAFLVPSAVFGMIRLFDSGRAPLTITFAALLSSLVAIALRRSGVPLLLAAPISAAGLAELIMHRHAAATLRWRFWPTQDTGIVLRALTDDGIAQFRELQAPVPDLVPFVAASVIGVWILAFITDWAALRLRLAFEPVLPAALLFIFTSVLGSGSHRLISTLVFAGGVAIWAVARRATVMRDQVWLTIDRFRGPAVVVRSASILAIVVIVGGLALGSRAPGFGSEEVYQWRGGGDSTRTVVSPFVSIESRLASQQNVEMFTVKADRPAYWRIAGLDTYADGFWSTRGTFEEERGDLPGAADPIGRVEPLVQEFELTGLRDIWVPAAYAPTRLIASDATITWNEEISSLTTDDDREFSDGITYEIESALPAFTDTELRAAAPVGDDDLLARYTDLPADLSPVVASTAAEVTAGATTPFDQMLALQTYFQAFDYSLELGPRGPDPIAQFLDERVGFCQQFSGTFALMARSLGVPARVAVGFTWGDPVAGLPDTYRVTGRQTHAWPEVYFEGYGWVSFEPTPGRGDPNSSYTGIAPQQDAPEAPTLEEPDLGETPDLEFPTPTIPDDFLTEPDLDAGAIDDAGAGSPERSTPWRLIGAVGAVGIYLVAMPLLADRRRHRRLSNAASPDEQVEASWRNLSEKLSWHLGVERPDSETRREWTEELIDRRRLPAEHLRPMADVVTVARYAPPGTGAITQDAADAVAGHGRAVEAVIDQRVPRWRQWMAAWNPRWLFR